MQPADKRSLRRNPVTKLLSLCVESPDGSELTHSLNTSDLRVAQRRATKIVGNSAAAGLTSKAVPIDPAAEPDPNRTHEAPASVEWAIGEHLQRSAPDLAEATRGAYRTQGGHIVRLLGGLRVSNLTRAHLEAYAARRTAERVCEETRRKELVLLRAALRRVRFLGVQPDEPETLLFPRLRCTSVPGDRWLIFDEYQRMMEELPEPRQLQLLVACYTGARRAELQRMRWEDIDWTRNEITVQQSKPKKSRRTIPLSAELKVILLKLRKPSGPLLGTFNNLYRELDRAAVKAKVKSFSLNDCRRTFASWMLQGGVPLYDVSKLLGHRSIAMVQKVYGHLSGDSLKRAISVLPTSEK